MTENIQKLYERGDTSGLMTVALRTDRPAEVNNEAYRALQLLARLGDRAAVVCCDALSGLQDSRSDCA
jgi:hypothetical protein